MVIFAILLGHLVGDILFQTYYFLIYKHKTTQACATHCFLYASGLYSTCCLFALPWWYCPVNAILHFPIDRYQLASRLMRIMRQDGLKHPPLGPWSVILVDQILHGICLFYTALLAGLR